MNQHLQNILNTIQEDKHLSEEEKNSVLQKAVSKTQDQVKLIQELKLIITPYILEKIKKEYVSALNYHVSDDGNAKYW